MQPAREMTGRPAEAAASEARQEPFLFALGKNEKEPGGYDRYTENLDRTFSQKLRSFDRLAQTDIVFIYDEARALLPNFFWFTRALTHFPRSSDIRTPLTLMTDTTTKISNFSPCRDRDPSLSSLRVTQMPRGVFPPFYLHANVDIWVDRSEGPKTLADMADPRFYCRYGRPYWGALARQFGEHVIKIQDVLELARAKVLGGLPSFSKSDLEQLLKQPAQALAILGIRACIDMVPQCQLSRDLVAYHMRTLYGIPADRDAVVTGYFSEPVLALAAGQLTNAVPNGWGLLLESLVQSLRDEQVDAGFRGELVARLLLLMAWDRCVLEGQSPFTSRCYLDAVPMVRFLSSLLRLGDSVKADLAKTFQHATVRCTHFIKIDYVPDSEQLLELFMRGAAAISNERQAGTDIIIPIVICGDTSSEIKPQMLSCIMVQVDNRRDGDPAYPETVTTLQTLRVTGIDIGKGLPYLSLYMSLGKKLGPGNQYLDTPVCRGHRLRSSGGGGGRANEHKCLAVFSISSLAYMGMDEAKIGLLDCLNQSWVDPIALQPSDRAKQLVANMLPCQIAQPKAREGADGGRKMPGGDGGVAGGASVGQNKAGKARLSKYAASTGVSFAIEAPGDIHAEESDTLAARDGGLSGEGAAAGVGGGGARKKRPKADTAAAEEEDGAAKGTQRCAQKRRQRGRSGAGSDAQ